MAITGIVTTTNNGVERITNLQSTGGATIDLETVVWDSVNSVLTANGAGVTITITNSQLKFDSDIRGGSSLTNSVLGTRDDTTLQIYDCMLLFAVMPQRVNISVYDIKRSTVIGEIVNPSQGLNFYLLDGAIVEETIIKNIVGVEFNGAPQVFFNITVDNTTYGYQNWQSGTLHFYGLELINVPLTAIHGTGAGGNNINYLWNSRSAIDLTLCALFSVNNRVYEGVSLGWEFLDKLTFLPVDNVRLIFRDNLAVTGAAVGERARYLTTNGRLNGTYDSRTSTTVVTQELATLFVISQKIDDIGANGSRTYPNPLIDLGSGLVADRNYNLDSVDIGIEIRSYEYEQPAGFSRSDLYVPNGAIGTLSSDGSTNTLEPFYITADANITVPIATANAYTALVDTEQLYDRAKADWFNTDDLILLTASGGLVVVPSGTNLIVTNAGAAYTYSAPDVTINSGTALASTTKLSGIQADNITFNNGTYPNNITLTGTVYLNGEVNLSNVTINGDLRINTALDSTLTFTNVTVTGNVFNDSTTNTLTINAGGTTSITTTEAGTTAGLVNIVSGQVTYTFNLSPAYTGYEYAIYTVTEAGSLNGSVEVQAVEVEASSTFSYTFTYAPNTVIAVQVLPKGSLDFKESVTYYELGNADQTITLNLVEDTNN